MSHLRPTCLFMVFQGLLSWSVPYGIAVPSILNHYVGGPTGADYSASVSTFSLPRYKWDPSDGMGKYSGKSTEETLVLIAPPPDDCKLSVQQKKIGSSVKSTGFLTQTKPLVEKQRFSQDKEKTGSLSQKTVLSENKEGSPIMGMAFAAPTEASKKRTFFQVARPKDLKLFENIKLEYFGVLGNKRKRFSRFQGDLNVLWVEVDVRGYEEPVYAIRVGKISDKRKSKPPLPTNHRSTKKTSPNHDLKVQKANIIQERLDSLVREILYLHAHFLYRCKKKLEAGLKRQDDLVNWVVHEVVQPDCGLPVFGLVDVINPWHLSMMAFGPIQQEVIRIFGATNKKHHTRMACTIIGTWHKNVVQSEEWEEFIGKVEGEDEKFWRFMEEALKEDNPALLYYVTNRSKT